MTAFSLSTVQEQFVPPYISKHLNSRVKQDGMILLCLMCPGTLI